MSELDSCRTKIRQLYHAEQASLLDNLMQAQPISARQRKNMTDSAVDMITRIRTSGETGLMELFLGEYGLSTHEGLCLMTLAEALLRVPDQATVSALIEDKIGGGQWVEHLGKSESALVNFSTRALVLTRSVLDVPQSDDVSTGIRSAVKRLGEPVIRRAVLQAMTELGKQFVLGETVDEALSKGMKLHQQGYRYSYDMLGEAALTADDAAAYLAAYTHAIETLTVRSTFDDVRDNPGISVKLSALHPRYEFMNRERVLLELVPRVSRLARLAAKANMGFNIDAEEANRLDISLDVIDAVLSDPELEGWNGFGVVVQAYGRRCSAVLDWLYALSNKLDRKIMVRLVKGAYWDTEIKESQYLGADDFPVFTDKAATDVAYICSSRQMLGMNDRIYSQFATHNAHTVAGILELAAEFKLAPREYEFQRLHGMGDALHDVVKAQHRTQCRIYAPVGSHRQLLAYLVRRLLENGANSSFVNQLSDPDYPAQAIAADPFELMLNNRKAAKPSPIVMPHELFGVKRRNSWGLDTTNVTDMQRYENARLPFIETQWQVGSLVAGVAQNSAPANQPVPVVNPADKADVVGHVFFADAATIEHALHAATPWEDSTATQRADVLTRASFRLEECHGELFALLTREAGKSALDAIAELREAVDFMRYYGQRAIAEDAPARGVFACISPWNFPLAIFLGQVSAALAAGNAVVCKPAESTVIVAYRAVEILYEAGVPREVLQLLPGLGADVGRAITSDARIHGVCFTGSTAVAQQINRTMADVLDANAPLIAETGGLNAMVVDSTALPEQAIKDVVASAFQSAGQRCSALRVLCVQEDIAEQFKAMLFGAMDELKVGKPWQLDTDVGPIINNAAYEKITAYIEDARKLGKVSKQNGVSPELTQSGHFIAPTVIQVDNFSDVTIEVFGPVLHLVTYKSTELDDLLHSINTSGYGLTFGLHTRIESRVEHIVNTMRVGNMYINRNQIGAVVGSQPFGGEGLSGTGPKAGGAHYLKRFQQYAVNREADDALDQAVDIGKLQKLIDGAIPTASLLETIELPGPTGESNALRLYAKGVVLCLGPTAAVASRQAQEASALGCVAIAIAAGIQEPLTGVLSPDQLAEITGIDAVIYEGSNERQKEYRAALAKRDRAIVALITTLAEVKERCVLERHVCVDTTAAGGNATLLAAY